MKIFLSTPISSYLTTEKMMEEEMAARIKLVLDHLKEHMVFNAAREEQWGKIELEGRECALRDFEEMKQSDLVIALLCEKGSEGVLIELGWASALGIPVIALVENGVKISKLLGGLPAISQFIFYTADWNCGLEEILRVIDERCCG